MIPIPQPYSKRFGLSCPNTRNMDTMMRQAAGLRKRASTDPEYVEFVAQNLERIAEDYAKCYQGMTEARAALMAIQEMTIGVVGKPIEIEDDDD